MACKARIDALGAFNNLIVRGIERLKIFRSDLERQNILNRLSSVKTLLDPGAPTSLPLPDPGSAAYRCEPAHSPMPWQKGPVNRSAGSSGPPGLRAENRHWSDISNPFKVVLLLFSTRNDFSR